MADESYFDIPALKPSRVVSNSPWVTQQHAANVQSMNEQQSMNQLFYCGNNGGEIRANITEDVPLSARPAQQYQTSNECSDNIDEWNPMDDDFACPMFNSYKYFDVLAAERPKERSPEKSTRQSPEKRAEEISLYVGNIPLGINTEGIKNLFVAVGEVKSCLVLPPKDPSSNTKYGFVKFCTWREAIKAIEAYDGFYVGNDLKLRVRVAHRRRSDGDIFSRGDEDGFSEETVQDLPTSDDPLLNGSNNNNGENTADKGTNVLPETPTQVHDTNGEQIMNEKSSNEANKTSPATTPRTMLPCTCCEKLCTQRCSSCKAPYCSRECQRLDKARHKLVCTYFASTPKSSKPPAPVPIQAHVTFEGPMLDPDSDSDFDCIDISLDTSQTSSKEKTSQNENENTLQSSVRNLAFDSGYTSSKEDMVNVARNESRHEDLNSGMLLARDESLHSDFPDAQKWLDKEFLAYVTAVSASNTFWAVLRTPDYARFCELTNQMTVLKEENLERIGDANIGSLCLARFSLDNCWYRSRITQGNAEQIEVIFVDYGNTEWKNIHDLYQLRPGFADVPSQAQQFILSGLTRASNSEMEQLMVKFLDSMVCNKTFFAELVCFSPGSLPEVILRENGAYLSINQQMVNYREQQAKNVIGEDNVLDQFNRSTKTSKGTEAQPLQNTFQQGTNETHCSITSYVSDNTSFKDQIASSVTGYITGDIPVNDPIIDAVSDNLAANDSTANYAYATPKNSMIGFTNASDNNPTGHYSSENIPENYPKTIVVSENISRKNSLSDYVSDNIPPNNAVTCFINPPGNNPMGNYSAENIPAGCPKAIDVSESVLRKYSLSSGVSDNIPPSDVIPNFTPNDPMPSHVSDLNPVNQLSNIGLKPYMASDVPSDVLPSTKTFDILVCHFLTPSSFWIWFLDTAKKIVNQLSSMLNTTYEHSTCSEYIPITGELIAAKYTDGVWYRAAVERINNDGRLRVHFIDFGNSEDVSLFDVRRVTDALASIPRLATKCALHGMEKPTGNWSAECLKFCSELMLNKRGSAAIRDEVQGLLVLTVDVDINGQMGSVVDEIIKQGYFFSKKMHIQDSDGHAVPNISNTGAIKLNNESDAIRYQPSVSDNTSASLNNKLVSPESKPVFPESRPVFSDSCSKPASLVSQAVSDNVASPAGLDSKQLVSPNVELVLPESGTSKPHIVANLRRPSDNPVTKPAQPISVQIQESDAKPASPNPPMIPKSRKQSTAQSYPLSQLSPNSVATAENVELKFKTLLPLPTVPTNAFDVIVNDVHSADRFYAQMIDPNLVSQLHKCVRELNEYVSKSHPPQLENVEVGSLGCAKFSSDNVWYRAQVVSVAEQNYKVRFIDFGNVENVQPNMFLDAPEFFYQLAPQAICCRLGASDQIWGEVSGEMMRKLTLNKRLSCTVLAGTSLLQHAVELQDTDGNKVVNIAEELSKALGSRRSVIMPSRPSSSKQTSVFTQKVLNPAVKASGIIRVGEKYEVMVTSTKHPTYFWAQCVENVEAIKRLQNDLGNHYSNNSYPPFQPEMNSFCACLSPTNNKWYRVFVKSASPQGFLVHSVDFGFTVSLEASLLRPLEEKFLSPPFGAVLLSMAAVEPIEGKLWNEEAIKYFRDKINLKTVKIRLVYNSLARLFVDVYDPDLSEECSLKTALIASGLAKEAHYTYPYFEESPKKSPSDRVPKGICEGHMPTAQNVPNSTKLDDYQNRAFKSAAQQGICTNNSRSQGDTNNMLEQVPDCTSYQHSPGQNQVPDSTSYQLTPGQNQVPACTSYRLTPGQNQVPDFSPSQDTNVSDYSLDACNIPSNNNLRHQSTDENPSPRFSSCQNRVSGEVDRPKFSVASDSSSPPDVVPNENQLDVFVSWVDSPESFWVQYAVLETVRGYASMSQQLNAACENSSENMPNVKLGDFCCSKFAGEWCRCKVDALLGNGLARVFYVDFGNREDVELAKLKPLTEEFRMLPSQALECTLADVHPRDCGWTPECVQWLRERILNKTLVAAVVQWSDDVLHVRVYDRSSSEPNVSINSLMLQSGI